MLGRIRDRNVWLVYATIFLLGAAYGSSLAVTPLRLAEIGFGKSEMGTLASWFAGGIVAMSIPAGALIRRFSAKKTLIVSLLLYAVAVSLFGLQRTYLGASAVRVLDGATSVGVWVGCETILLARSDASNKAFVTSLYAMSIAVGYVVGALAARVLTMFTGYQTVFFAAGGFALLALLVVAFGLDADKGGGAVVAASDEEAGPYRSPADQPETAPLSSWALLYRIKTSCFATLAYGYFQASVVLFLPIFLVHSKGVAEKDTILMTAFFAAGMLLFSNVAGRLGDRHGHLRVMTVLATVGMFMTLGFVLLSSWTIMLGAIFVAGATLASISPVSLALSGLISERRDFARANGIYNACYAVGMLVGPPLSSVIFDRISGAAMLLHLAAMWATFIAFCIFFRKDDPRARAVPSLRETAPAERRPLEPQRSAEE